MRLFIAIDLHSELREKITNLIQKLKATGADVKWVEPENLHITLKFLGDVEEERIDEIREIVRSSLSNQKAFDIEIDGMGFFENEKYLRVIWIGLSKGKERVMELMDILNRALNHIRHERLKSAAHITIGRVRSGKNKQALLDAIKKLSTLDIGSQIVKEIAIKQSQLTKQGPVYRDVEILKLIS